VGACSYPALRWLFGKRFLRKIEERQPKEEEANHGRARIMIAGKESREGVANGGKKTHWTPKNTMERRDNRQRESLERRGAVCHGLFWPSHNWNATSPVRFFWATALPSGWRLFWPGFLMRASFPNPAAAEPSSGRRPLSPGFFGAAKIVRSNAGRSSHRMGVFLFRRRLATCVPPRSAEGQAIVCGREPECGWRLFFGPGFGFFRGCATTVRRHTAITTRARSERRLRTSRVRNILNVARPTQPHRQPFFFRRCVGGNYFHARRRRETSGLIPMRKSFTRIFSPSGWCKFITSGPRENSVPPPSRGSTPPPPPPPPPPAGNGVGGPRRKTGVQRRIGGGNAVSLSIRPIETPTSSVA